MAQGIVFVAISEEMSGSLAAGQSVGRERHGGWGVGPLGGAVGDTDTRGRHNKVSSPPLTQLYCVAYLYIFRYVTSRAPFPAADTSNTYSLSVSYFEKICVIEGVTGEVDLTILYLNPPQLYPL